MKIDSLSEIYIYLLQPDNEKHNEILTCVDLNDGVSNDLHEIKLKIVLEYMMWTLSRQTGKSIIRNVVISNITCNLINMVK